MSGERDKNEDRFGMPESAFQAAWEAHRHVLRTGMYVPTRVEVATWPVKKLTAVLVDWMWESPAELISSNEQIAAVVEVLESRDDADDVRELIAACREYLSC